MPAFTKLGNHRALSHLSVVSTGAKELKPHGWAFNVDDVVFPRHSRPAQLRRPSHLTRFWIGRPMSKILCRALNAIKNSLEKFLPIALMYYNIEGHSYQLYMVFG